MNKPFLATALASILLTACDKSADTPAPEAPAATAPVAESAATPTDDVAAPAATDTGAAQTADDHHAINASIDTLLGDHAKYETVIDDYQKAVAGGDKEAVAALVGYPIDVTIDGKKTSIKDTAGFVRNYDKIITPAIAEVIQAQKYSDLLVNGQGVMFGSGETWINGICKKGSADCSEFEVKVVTIQAGGSS